MGRAVSERITQVAAFAPLGLERLEQIAHGGRGLGLSLAHQTVVERHQGGIQVRSKPGETLLQVRLPIHPPSALTPQPPLSLNASRLEGGVGGGSQ